MATTCKIIQADKYPFMVTMSLVGGPSSGARPATWANKPPKGRFMVKVQPPMDGYGPALVYDQSRKYTAMIEATPELMVEMDGRVRAWFFAKATKKELTLLFEAPSQNW